MAIPDRRALERRENVRRNTDRRRPRLAVPGLAVRVLKAGDEGRTLHAGRLIDISLTGVQLVLDGDIAVDDVLLIEARLDDGCLNLSARVARTRIEEAGQVVGCRLASPPPPEKLAVLRRLTRAVPTK